MNEPIADSKPYATFVFNHEGEQYVMRRDYERLRAMLTWVPVEERLPDQVDDVVVWHPSRIGTGWAWYDGDGKWFSGDYEVLVSHWMPFPAPPETNE
jgi:hypothetical protein